MTYCLEYMKNQENTENWEKWEKVSKFVFGNLVDWSYKKMELYTNLTSSGSR